MADTRHPAQTGDAVVIYCSGFGQVDHPVGAGFPAPADTLSQTTIPAVLTIGGQSARVFFSGLTPGLTGLYQINAIVPDGIIPGDNVTVVLSVGGFGGPAVTIAVASGAK